MRFCLFVTLAACLVFYGSVMQVNPNLETLGSGKLCIYSAERVSSPYFTNVTDLGFSYIYECKSGDAARVRTLFQKIDGESITIQNIEVRTILRKLGCRKISAAEFGTMTTIYAYSPHGKAFIRNGNQKINLQIAKKADTVTVGWPVILGSY